MVYKTKTCYKGKGYGLAAENRDGFFENTGVGRREKLVLDKRAAGVSGGIDPLPGSEI